MLAPSSAENENGKSAGVNGRSRSENERERSKRGKSADAIRRWQESNPTGSPDRSGKVCMALSVLSLED